MAPEVLAARYSKSLRPLCSYPPPPLNGLHCVRTKVGWRLGGYMASLQSTITLAGDRGRRVSVWSWRQAIVTQGWSKYRGPGKPTHSWSLRGSLVTP